MTELSLAEFGLETTDQAALRRGQHQATVRKWVADGRIPAVVIGSGRTARYLVRIADVDAIPVRTRGAPEGNANAAKESAAFAAKPTKTRAPEKSRKKSRNP